MSYIYTIMYIRVNVYLWCFFMERTYFLAFMAAVEERNRRIMLIDGPAIAMTHLISGSLNETALWIANDTSFL